MNRRRRYLLGLLFLVLPFIAFGWPSPEQPPEFLLTWGYGVATGEYASEICLGACQAGYQGSGDGQFQHPHDVAVDASGNIFVVERHSHRIQKFDRMLNFVTKWGTFCDTGSAGPDGCDGDFNYPESLAVDASGNVFVGDSANHRLQKFDNSGTYLAKWGSNGTTEGQFDWPSGVTVDSAGSVYVTDSYNSRIQKFDGSGTFISMWGWGVASGAWEFQICTGSCLVGISGPGDGQFSYPQSVAVDASGNVYVVDKSNQRVQKFSSALDFVTKWGTYCDTGASGPDGCDGKFNYPVGIAVDASGSVYVSGYYNNRVQMFDSAGSFLTKWGVDGEAEGQFDWPRGLAVDSSGRLYVADTYNHRIQKFGDPWLDLFIGEPELPDGR